MSTERKYIVAGIGTEVGKTVVSAILTEKLHAEYWKPIQAGDLDNSDTIKVRNWVENSNSIFHPEAFRLNHPMSPHAAAARDGVKIEIEGIKTPNFQNNAIIELAGGLLVPVNNQQTNVDLIKQINLPVILVINFYLGSINHSLLSINYLQEYNIPLAGVIFNGEVNEESKDVILRQTGVTELGTIPQVDEISPKTVTELGQYLNI